MIATLRARANSPVSEHSKIVRRKALGNHGRRLSLARGRPLRLLSYHFLFACDDCYNVSIAIAPTFLGELISPIEVGATSQLENCLDAELILADWCLGGGFLAK